jgi:ABC-2 type transport system ATP-binding protein
VEAVKGVSFDIEQGSIFSLLGPNGAGKTTLIGMLSGLLQPSDGDAYIAGYSIRTSPKDVKRQIGVVPQEIALYSQITGRENLEFWGKMYKLSKQERVERIETVLEITGLTDRADDKVNEFSGGMKRRLNIAVGLLHAPQILFLDEPTVGIDPQSRRRILDTIQELNRQGITILYTTHYMEEAEELSHRIGILDHGELIALGSREELNAQIVKYDTVRLTLSEGGYDLDETVRTLNTLPHLCHSYTEDDTLILQTENVKEMLAEMIGYFNSNGVAIKKLEIEEPSLESVFLQLTGRELRD